MIRIIGEATKEAFAEIKAEKEKCFSEPCRAPARLSEPAKSRTPGLVKIRTADDLKNVSQAIVYLKQHELYTLEDLDAALSPIQEKASAISKDMKTAANRMKVINDFQNAVADCQTHKAVHDKYIKIGWKSRQAAFADKHKDELTAFNKAYRCPKKHGVDLNVNLEALQAEHDGLKKYHAEMKAQLATVKEELQPMKDIRYLHWLHSS